MHKWFGRRHVLNQIDLAIDDALSPVRRRLELGPAGDVRDEIAAEAGAAPISARAG